MNEFRIIADSILKAKVHTDLFAESMTPEQITDLYHQLAKGIHPDKHQGTDREAEATRAMTRLNELHDIATGKTPPPPAWTPITIKVKTDVYTVEAPICHGDLADIHGCKKEGSDTELVMKVVRNVADNDLMNAEVSSLKALSNGLEAFKQFVPAIHDSFVMSGKPHRRCTVMEKIEDHLSLADILKKKPKGLDYRDITWMLKRALSSVGFAHSAGYVYGGFTLENVLVHPVSHGMKLLDWCYSVKAGTPLKAYSLKSKEFYPQEVFKKQPATDRLDVYMIAAAFETMLDLDAPPRFKRLLKGCLLANPNQRPEAWALYDELCTLMLELVGAPKYRELVL